MSPSQHEQDQGNYCAQPGHAEVRERVADGQALCPNGLVREFSPVNDLHVGAITSSLGGFGGDRCALIAHPRLNDRAHLIPTQVSSVPSYDGRGYWVWDPAGAQVPTGETNSTTFAQSIRNGILAAGSEGCGYEATLEAWYRFLVTPDPFQAISVDPLTSLSVQTGTDSILLAQRARFLRPDSHVAIVVFSGEDDCSILDSGFGWLVGSYQVGGTIQSFRMPRATSACEADPNNPCCRSCATSSATPNGCAPVAEDAACQIGPLSEADDANNLRCFDQKRRFGTDFLQPVSRYVSGSKNRWCLIVRATETEWTRSSTDPRAASNGHEYTSVLGDDLEYSCNL